MVENSEQFGDFGDEEKTMYHMGFAYMNRLNLLLYQCNEAARIDDMEEWYKCLKNLFKELETKMNDKERETQDKELIVAEKFYTSFVEKRTNYLITIANPRNRSIPFIVPQEIPYFMFKWELSLRRVIDRIGMLMPSADDIRFAVGGQR